MLSVSKITDSGAAHHYFSERDDYYLRDRDSGSAAQWWGAGAERAGLAGEVEPGAFKDALEGRIGGQQIGHADRHTPGWDNTFSASKSVSFAALVRGDRRLIEAHDRAVREALGVLEAHSAMTRQRAADGGYTFRETGNLAAAVFRHSSNRDQEPQLHSHAVIVNATYDKTAGKWVSLWTRDGIYKAQREANAVYTNALAREARALGYHVEWSVNDKGHPSFELAEVAPGLRELFSGRTAAIDAELAAHGLTRATATPDQKQAATLATRKAKEHVPGQELAHRWREQAAAHGADLQRPDPTPEPRDAVADARESQDADAAVAAATAQLAEREARFTRRELMIEARVFSQGKASEKALSAAVDRAHERGLLIDRRVEIKAPGNERAIVSGYTTEAGAQTERSMLVHSGAVAEQGRDGPRIGEHDEQMNTAQAIDARIAAAERDAGYRFTDEHRRAVHGILEGHSGLSIVQGLAGTSKTTSILSVVTDHAKAGDWRVIAMAPSVDATRKLGDTIGAEAQTVAAYIKRQSRDDGRPTVLIVDEAGLLSAKDMDALMAKAEQQGTRVVLAGDDNQFGSVAAGRAFMQTQAEHPDVTYGVTDIKRQRNDEQRAAVYDALAGRAAEALDKVEVHEQSEREKAIDELATDYMRGTADGNDVLAVTLSRVDRSDLNAEIQARREAAGEVHDVQIVKTLQDRQWTGAQRADAARYAAGDVIQANRKFAHLDRGEVAVVTGVADGKVTVERASGETWTFDPKRVKEYTVLAQTETRIGAGDRVVAKGAIRAADAEGNAIQIANGSQLDVRAVREGAIDVRDRDGNAYTIDTAQGARLDLGYVQTARQAQGQDVGKREQIGRVIAWERSTQTNLADRASLYEIISRSKDQAAIYTDDKAKLAETVSRNAGHKSTALDQDLDHPARPSPATRDTTDPAPARIPARERALRSLAELEASTRRMADQGRRNERRWAALQRADNAKQGRAIDAQRREQQRQSLVEQATSRIDKREKAELKSHARRNGYILVPSTFKGLRERWAIQRHAKEDRERVTLAFSGERDSKRSRQLDAKRIKDLKREIRGVRKQAKEIKKAVSRGRSVLSPVRAWKRMQVDSKADDRVARIREKIDVVKARQADRKGRDLQAKAQEREALRQQREAAKAARAPRQQAPDRGEREDYSRGR